MKKVLAAATVVALACSGVVSTTTATATAQESGTFADQFQPGGGAAFRATYTPTKAYAFLGDIGAWVDRFEGVKFGNSPYPGVTIEQVQNGVPSVPEVRVSLTGGKIYPKQFTVPVSGTVFYSDGSHEELNTEFTIYPVRDLVEVAKTAPPQEQPWVPTTPDNTAKPGTPGAGEKPAPNYPGNNDGGSSDEGGHIAETVLWALVSVASLAGLGVIFHLATQENPFPGLLFLNRDK